ncbi:MAG: S16 family serine protease, partial [Tepidisphaeraceae bacterium]
TDDLSSDEQALLLNPSSGEAPSAGNTSTPSTTAPSTLPSVTVTYSSGPTGVQHLKSGMKWFMNRRFFLANVPDEVNGLMVTRCYGGVQDSTVSLDIPAGATVYLLIDSDKGGNANDPGLTGLHHNLASSNWTRLGAEAQYGPTDQNFLLTIYKQSFAGPEQLTLQSAGFTGIRVAAASLVVSAGQQAPSNDSGPAPPEAVTDSDNAKPITKLQTSIEALYVVEQDTGGMLGLASRFILTATPGKSGRKIVPVVFATPVGPQMHLVLDDVVRAINVNYKLVGVRRIELSFEDKYTAKDGGSIGAAIGTLMLSMIQGFDIDPNLAITGDVTADAKVRKIGGVAAKLRGAAEAGCTIVAVPSENPDQIQDAMVYDGPSILFNVHVLGITDLDDAASVARTDRADRLTRAISLFSSLQQTLKDTPEALDSDATIAQLEEILSLAPNDYSARFLLMAAEHKIPHLSAAASEYYTFVAINEMMESITNGKKVVLNEAACEVILQKLGKVRPLSDLTVRPWIDAWIDFIRAGLDVINGQGSDDYFEQMRQRVNDEAIKLSADRDLAEKMLREGV